MQSVSSLKVTSAKAICFLTAVVMFFIVSFTNMGAAHADSLKVSATQPFYLLEVATQPDVISQLKAEFMPQLNEILTPRQEKLFEEAVSGGTSFRKAFKNLMLTPDQKQEIKVALNSVPKKDLFASLTPTQKKELFLKKKEAFMPSSEEIIDRINTGMPAGESVSKEIQTKIETGLKKRDEFMPSAETIMEKIEAGIENVKESLGD